MTTEPPKINVPAFHIECHQLKRYGEVLGKKQKDLLKKQVHLFLVVL
jgi:hypothetical protein